MLGYLRPHLKVIPFDSHSLITFGIYKRTIVDRYFTYRLVSSSYIVLVFSIDALQSLGSEWGKTLFTITVHCRRIPSYRRRSSTGTYIVLIESLCIDWATVLHLQHSVFTSLLQVMCGSERQQWEIGKRAVLLHLMRVAASIANETRKMKITMLIGRIRVLGSRDITYSIQ
jgi:hypothetical protein